MTVAPDSTGIAAWVHKRYMPVMKKVWELMMAAAANEEYGEAGLAKAWETALQNGMSTGGIEMMLCVTCKRSVRCAADHWVASTRLQ